MRVQVRGRNILEMTDEFRDHVARRFHFALGRFGSSIERVTVRLEDVNGPRGGVDKRCQVEVVISPSGSLLIADADSDLYTMIDRVADRARRAAVREFEKRREFVRESADYRSKP